MCTSMYVYVESRRAKYVWRVSSDEGLFRNVKMNSGDSSAKGDYYSRLDYQFRGSTYSSTDHHQSRGLRTLPVGSLLFWGVGEIDEFNPSIPLDDIIIQPKQEGRMQVKLDSLITLYQDEDHA